MKTKQLQDKDMLRVGDLARLTNKTVRAIHYYEELGLIRPEQRTSGGFRLFTQRDVQRVDVITRLQELGFTLEQIVDLVRIWRQSPEGTVAAEKLRDILESGVRAAQKKIGLLQSRVREIQTSLLFLHTCGGCNDKPGRTCCPMCTKGDHEAKLPPFIDALIQ